MINKCPTCGGKFGLVGYWEYARYTWGRYFCRITCRDEYIKKKAERLKTFKPPDTVSKDTVY